MCVKSIVIIDKYEKLLTVLGSEILITITISLKEVYNNQNLPATKKAVH
jgi:hypothetical protein